MNKFIKISSVILILFSALSIVSVSFMAFVNPQDIMALVGVQLPNNDAYSSIRGVYGGVGLVIFITLIYLAIKDRKKGLSFLVMLWGMYAISRLITIAAEGPLGAFGRQWLTIETCLCILAGVLLLAGHERKPA